MGHHGMKHGWRQGHGAGALPGIPRGFKIALVLVVLFVLLAGVAVAALVVLVLAKLVSGGSLPSYLQVAFDFVERNVQPLLNIWKSIQGLGGK